VNARDFERLLQQQGGSSAKLDATTRRLRARGLLPSGGRGSNAPEIGPAEAAVILIAFAGSLKGTEADARFEKLQVLRSAPGTTFACSLVEALASYLANPSRYPRLTKIRISKTHRYAAFEYKDGGQEEFLPARPKPIDDRLQSEGILTATLLKILSDQLMGGRESPDAG
jgi:hypothetical protein